MKRAIKSGAKKTGACTWKKKMPSERKFESETTMLSAVLSVFLFLIAMHMLFGTGRRRILAVMSPDCGYCRRAHEDIVQNKRTSEFEIVEPSAVESDPELFGELRGAGYTGSVPFFYNRECGKTVTGYRPTTALLAALK
jgi:hypothetical protein